MATSMTTRWWNTGSIQLSVVPAIVRDVDDETALRVAMAAHCIGLGQEDLGDLFEHAEAEA